MAPRSKKKAPNGRTHTPLGLLETMPVSASPRGVWELGESCRLGGSYTSRASGKFGGSSVIGLTWGGGTFRSFIGKFPLSSPPFSVPTPLPRGLTIRPPKPFKNDLAQAAGPSARLLAALPLSSPPPSARGRGAISFRAEARGPHPRTRAQPGEATGGDGPRRLVGPSWSGCDSSGDNSFYTVGGSLSSPQYALVTQSDVSQHPKDYTSEGARKMQKFIPPKKAVLFLEKAAGQEVAAQCLRRGPDCLCC
ncbi:hypothetical protein R6Z07M_005674 [Ovis aries]